jgi:oligosaccharide repeat unit polymerase
MRVEGEIGTGIPYIFAGVHMALFLTGIYTAYKNKFNFLILIPFLIIILKSLAEVSRAGLLLGLFEFIIGFVFYKQYLNSIKTSENKSNKKIIFGLVIILALVIAGATAVKVFRAPYESFKASSSSLNKFEKGIFFSPTIYLYLSSHIGVLNNYLQEQDENNYFGEVTFFPVYRLISKFEVIEEPRYYQKGYFIPMWSNTGTYLRDLHADFGYFGLFLIPFLLGMISTFYWIKFYENKRMIDFIILGYITIVMSYSFLLMATRFGNWLISLIGFVIIIPLLERRYSR